jgi:hypothetical protein
MSAKQRVRMLIFGCFCLAISLYAYGVWLAAIIDPEGRSSSATPTGLFVGLFFGTSVYFALRPLVPHDQISN